ncbi:precorrin-2 C(20)-methyltransferase [Pseudonocardia sp. KRD-184]|uniref:Precorrin-2 C(20)-methyltransferase n=1 Tax=Pseudonocardia oceani TaxID=2792013 RepID=A0ABS6U3Q6_9PSEU|nr:precorrin-2 C(20)-methyltransferase [Pseudonocardia oceani]MBW0092994.1 precorrin-2 C(20)-methyltransferase [Pseudonocardia oceani]MBW0098960.1 precorrin-2 C(20)-methyltransferase [Pseudonocardia oceani]MBW0111489.1 precorrin-2 C(20)-methyltransferase [Pseudonocardia oceani]MBW0125212.1 precorrin-2 C(20)-methyltransferase [Pseudonocardia oceani]MBW0126864.1 precorrin-2 C(20)-methyltransferase [Pseudonocardia oceani]
MSTLVGVGVGPGDPDLVTVKAANLLAKADVVFVPVADSGETGRAEQTVLFYAEAWRVERVVFALHDREHTARRERAWDDAAAQVARWFAEHRDQYGNGGTAAFATIGDPCVYSTFTYLAATVRDLVGDLSVELIPGITAMQDLAARSGTPLVEGREALSLFPMTAGADRFREALDRGDSVVAYKFGRMLPETLAVLRETGRLDGAVYGSGLGLPEEDVRPASELDPDAPGPYLSTLIVPPARTGRGGAL